MFFPDWSSDGELILFSSPYVVGGGGFICTPDFKKYWQIYNHYQLEAYQVSWFSDYQMIGCLKSNNWALEEIFIIDTTLMNQVRLTTNNESDRYPSVSPLQDLIAWSCNVQIYVMSSNGSNKKRLDYGQYPCWTPDGECIVYSHASPDYTKEVIWKIDADGKNKIQLTF
jgi:Tol biopolymer transport system component